MLPYVVSTRTTVILPSDVPSLVSILCSLSAVSFYTITVSSASTQKRRTGIGKLSSSIVDGTNVCEQLE